MVDQIANIYNWVANKLLKPVKNQRNDRLYIFSQLVICNLIYDYSFYVFLDYSFQKKQQQQQKKNNLITYLSDKYFFQLFLFFLYILRHICYVHGVQRGLIPPSPLFGNHPLYRKVLTPSQTAPGIYLRKPVNCVNSVFL